MERIFTKTVNLVIFSMLVIASSIVSAQTDIKLDTPKGLATTQIDNLIIESVITDKNRLGKKISIKKNINDLTIEDQNTGITICIGVSSCNDMIAYCVGTLDVDPPCTYNNKGQPIGCVC